LSNNSAHPSIGRLWSSRFHKKVHRTALESRPHKKVNKAKLAAASSFSGFLGGLLGRRIRGSGFFPAGHFQDREQVKDPAVVDQVHPFRVQTDKVGAIFPAFAANAGIDAEQVGVRTVDAFRERDADLGNGDFTGTANREEVPAGYVMLAFWEVLVVFNEAENPASHENVRMLAVIGLDLFQAFIRPVDAVFAVYHIVTCRSVPGRTA
jgi:hypothetical protein